MRQRLQAQAATLSADKYRAVTGMVSPDTVSLYLDHCDGRQCADTLLAQLVVGRFDRIEDREPRITHLPVKLCL